MLIQFLHDESIDIYQVNKDRARISRWSEEKVDGHGGTDVWQSLGFWGVR